MIEDRGAAEAAGHMDFDLDPERLIGSVVKSTLFGRGKRARGVGRLVSRSGGLLNGKTLLALGGLAWGLYETATAQQGQQAPAGGPPPAPGGTPWPPAGAGAAGPPPLPGSAGPAAAPSPAPTPAIPDGVRRVIQLTLSAGRADGTLSEAERGRIIEHAREAGVEGVVAQELDRPMPLAEIVRGVTDPAQRADFYTLAFAITRADEQVTGGERVYLAQLAHLLGLTPDDTARLEAETAARIDAERAADAGASPS